MLPDRADNPPDRSRITTEQPNPASAGLHAMSAERVVATIQQADRDVLSAMERARPALVGLIEAAEGGFCRGGRLIYVGAGTSGRLGVLDASEAPPTFCVEPDRVVGIIAGGDRALRQSSEGMEDDPRGAWGALEELDLTADDTVIGIAAGGTTPYVTGLYGCFECGGSAAVGRPVTGMITCAAVDRPRGCDHLIVLETGPEVLTGSTRMKAGTATKLALNTISTALMVRAGRVYENLMVDLSATNAKLRDRAARIIATLCDCDRNAALALLHAADGRVKTAVVMDRLDLDREAADRRLRAVDGRLDRALGET